MPMSPERQRAFDRLLWRERIRRVLELAPLLAIGLGLCAGLLWLRTHGEAAWIGLMIAATAGVAKPALMAIRVREQRRRRNRVE
jgi:hypothetical protein